MGDSEIVNDGILARVMALQADYARFVDTRDTKSWGRLFGDHGVLAVGDRELTGQLAIAEFGSSSTVGVHIQAVPRVESRIDGRVDATSSFLFVNSATGALIAGLYKDELAPAGDGFVFARRQIDVLARTEVP